MTTPTPSFSITPPPLIHLPHPSITKPAPAKGSHVYYVDINSLKWTLHVPEANEIVERALYRGFFDIIDRAELSRLRLSTESAWNTRAKTSKEKAQARLKEYKKEYKKRNMIIRNINL